MAIFGWGKKSGGGEEDGKKPDGGKAAELAFSPEKARAWFDRAQTYFETDALEYSLTCWLSGLRQDPTNLDAVQKFFKTASAYNNTPAGKKGPSKDVVKATQGTGSDLDKFLRSLLEFAFEPSNAPVAIDLLSRATELGLKDVAAWLGPVPLNAVIKSDRPKKDQLIKLMHLYVALENFDMAVKAGEGALQLDPGDNTLRADLRDLAAQASISRGGYEKVGEAGGFRANVKDLDAQRKREEGDRIVKTDEVHARVIEESRVVYNRAPQDRPSIKGYLKALIERGTPEDEAEAIKISEKAFSETQEFQFRKFAGDVRMRAGKKALRELKVNAEAHPNDPVAQMKYKDGLAKQIALEIAEFKAIVNAYPTDLKMKYELGIRELDAGNYEGAIEQLQVSKGDGLLKIKSMFGLAIAFQKLGWDDEAIETFRNTMDAIPDLQAHEMGLELRYGLMVSLQKKASESRDIAAAEEASKLATSIGLQQIGFKDIRVRRDQIKAILAALKPQAPGI